MQPIYTLPPVFRGPAIAALAEAENVNWGMDTFKVDTLRSKIPAGKRIKVGVVDTGVDASHPLMGNLVKAKDFTGSASGSNDRNGHGTHVSGTVAATDKRIGVGAEFIDLYHGKGLSDSGSGGNTLLDAIAWCLSEGCTVVSNSWGGGGQDPAWEAEFKKMADTGAWLVFAGGNSGPNTPDTDWPGRSQHLINVAALNADLTPASFSSAGNKIDTSGPGVNIISCKPGGGFTSMSGTSMATPFIAPNLAGFRLGLELAGKPIPNVYKLREVVFERSTDVYTPGDDRRTGPGYLTPLLLEMLLHPDPFPVK